MIQVNKPFLPPYQDYEKYIKGIWERVWLTNNGPLVLELEQKLREYLDVPYLLFMNNGTIAIQIAIKALNLKGEILTTPFSYVATTSSIVWEGCEPVFVDVHPQSLNLDPAKIEAAITPRTSAILATHVYGNPCDVEAIQAIADKHGLKVIYDSAHCFGSKYKGKSVFAYGDVNTTSFHATKLFHTTEGGAVFANDPKVLARMAFMRNFGHNGPAEFAEVGINGKNSEFHAAMGLCNLNYIQAIMDKRKADSLYYDEKLKGLRITKPFIADGVDYNYAYYTVLFESEQVLLKQVAALEAQLIFPRRYFYPSLSSLNYVNKQSTPICDDISKRVLCLPLYYDLAANDIDRIAGVLLGVQNTI